MKGSVYDCLRLSVGVSLLTCCMGQQCTPIPSLEDNGDQVLGFTPSEPPLPSDGDPANTNNTDNTSITNNTGNTPDQTGGYSTGTPWSVTKAVGLMPRSYDQDGMLDAFAQASQTAQVGVVQVPFSWDLLKGQNGFPTYHANYDWLQYVDPADGQTIFERHGLKRGYWLSFVSPADTSTINISEYPVDAVKFTDPNVTSAYVDECKWFAEYFRPDYLAIGTEIDTYLEKSSPQERDALLAAMSQAYAECKAILPEATVFVYFQYEHVRAENLWELIRPFAELSDVTAFSSYPSLPINGADTGWTAATLPEDYYVDIIDKLDPENPIAFAELGHPSRNSSFFTAGSETEQAAFVTKICHIASTLQASFATWTYLYDPSLGTAYPPDILDYFSSMGIMNDLHKPAWEQWLQDQ